MSTLSIILFLSQVFAGISFTPEQCQRFKAEGLTGGDYYINEALARDCKIQVPEGDDGYFMNLALTEDLNYNNKKDCDLKSNKNLGDFKKVVTFNNMHPDYFYPDRVDEYPFVFGIQVPSITEGYNLSSGVSVNIDSVKGCREKLELMLGEKLKNSNVIMTAGHSFIIEDANKCMVSNERTINKSGVASGRDLSNYQFGSEIDKVVCSANSCEGLNRDTYNDFCIVITKKEIQNAAEYKSIDSLNKNEKTYLVAYQPALVSSLKDSSLKRTERVISVNNERLRLGKTKISNSSKKLIIHHADAGPGSSGGGVFSSNKEVVGINVKMGDLNGQAVQEGVKGTWLLNYAIDPQIACQRLSVVLK